jgi:hypothetical protein
MPRKSGCPTDDGDSSDPLSESAQIIADGIDALNAMCIEMRKLGMIACAEVLDQAFAVCLREYVEHYDARQTDSRSDPSPPSDDT